MALANLAGSFQKLTLGGAAQQVIGKAIKPQTIHRCSFHTTTPVCHKVRNAKLSVPHRDHADRWRYIKSGVADMKYTVRPLAYPKNGGRGPDGRVWTHHIGGGHKQRYRMVDHKRQSETEKQLVEKVDSIQYDPLRSARLALVASGEHKRYIIATQNMKAGDIIKTSTEIPRMPVKAQEGDAHPLGALPVGSLVNCVEQYKGSGGQVARAAGTTAQVLRKVDGKVIVKMPSKREIIVSEECMATVGRVSNVDHNKRVIGKAGRNRWLGIRPASGWWQRKTGRFGRKIKPTPRAKDCMKPPRVHQEAKPFTVPQFQFSRRF